MKVTGIQLDIAWEDPGANFQKCETLLAGAAEEGGRLLVLPEMFATGFSMSSEENAAHEGPVRDFLSERAKALGVWILGGFVEVHAPMPRNVCALFDPGGEERLRYRKLHPFTLAGEDKHFSAGEAILTCEVEGVRVTPLICYDLRFPEPFRLAPKTDPNSDGEISSRVKEVSEEVS